MAQSATAFTSNTLLKSFSTFVSFIYHSTCQALSTAAVNLTIALSATVAPDEIGVPSVVTTRSTREEGLLVTLKVTVTSAMTVIPHSHKTNSIIDFLIFIGLINYYESILSISSYLSGYGCLAAWVCQHTSFPADHTIHHPEDYGAR